MAFTNPATRSTGYTVEAADWNLFVTNEIDLNTRLSAAESGKVPTTRTVATSNQGITGGGDLSANRTLSIQYGTAVNTVAQGNDSRITVTQDGTIGNSALGTRISTLETIKNTVGRWYYSGSSTVGASDAIVPVDTVDTGVTVSGMSLSSGVVTVTNAGYYNLQGNLHFTAPSGAGNHWLYLAPSGTISDSVPRWGANAEYLPASAGTFALNVSAENVYLSAGATVTLRYYNSTGTAVSMTVSGRHATNLAISRVG